MKNYKTYKITNIRWDDDQEDTSHLPSSKTIVIATSALQYQTAEDIIADSLCDSEGWLVMDFDHNELKA